MEDDRFPSQQLSSVQARTISSNSGAKTVNSLNVHSGSQPVESPKSNKARFSSKQASQKARELENLQQQLESKNKKYRSNLTGTSKKQGIIRRDQNGVKIQKGIKRHKVTFRDEARNEELYQLYIVDSYKKYNQLQQKSCCCSCNIF